MKRFLGVLLLLAGCGHGGADGPMAASVQATRVSLLAAGETGVLLGRVAYPPGFVPAPGSAAVDVVGSGGFRARATLSAAGTFRIGAVPLDTPLTLEVAARYGALDMPLKALAKLATRVGCATVDLASTVLVAKATGPHPWVVPPAGPWPDPLETMDGTRFDEVEERLRDDLDDGAAGGPDRQADEVGHDRGSDLFDEVVRGDPGLGEAYDQAMQGGDASLVLRIKSVGRGLLAAGENHAPIPGKGSPRIFGVLELEVVPTPAVMQATFYLNERAIGTVSAATGWALRLDTWSMPDGSYTLSTVGEAADGTRQVLDRSYVAIANDAGSLCQPR